MSAVGQTGGARRSKTGRAGGSLASFTSMALSCFEWSERLLMRADAFGRWVRGRVRGIGEWGAWKSQLWGYLGC